MIAGLRGRLDSKLPDALLVDVGGVVFRVGTSANTLSEVGDVGEAVRLQTYLFVREDQLTLYGFTSDEELRLFETLIGVTGVGPRLACAILSHLRVEALQEAIQAGNADLLATVPGVGKKTAARLIVELRGKLPSTLGAVTTGPVEAEVIEALRALGYTTAEANSALGRIGATPNMSVEEKVLAALRELGQ
jgi:holliday junction DNA helicase RuvA